MCHVHAQPVVPYVVFMSLDVVRENPAAGCSAGSASCPLLWCQAGCYQRHCIPLRGEMGLTKILRKVLVGLDLTLLKIGSHSMVGVRKRLNLCRIINI